MNNLSNISDLDITTGNNKIKFLAKEIALKFPNSPFREMGDGHSQINIDKLKVDFSSNYMLPGLKPILQQSGLQNPSEMQMELYSRDFTCNALLMTIDLQKILDPIGLGLNDIKRKRLRTCMPAYFTLGNDNKRVVRVIYLACKLGFELDEEIVNWIKQHPESMGTSDSAYTVKKLKSAFYYDSERAEKIISDLGLWSYVPPDKDLLPYITKNVRKI